MKLKNDNDCSILEEKFDWAGSQLKTKPGDGPPDEPESDAFNCATTWANHEKEGGFLQKLKRAFGSHPDGGLTTLPQ